MTKMRVGDSRRISIEEAYQELEKSLIAFLRAVPPSILPYTGHLSSSLGKNLRGRALLTAALGDDGLLDSGALDLAVAIEAFHLATLVHDDIIDDAELRRGQKSLQAAFGKKTAVLCGDYLLAKSLELSYLAMSRRKSLATGERGDFSLPQYAGLVCMGEIRQNANNFNLDLSKQRYLSIIRGKTAVLFEAAFAGGESFLEEKERISPRATEAYKKFGRYTGMIFQMMDDLLDIEKTQDQANKPILSDLKSGVITLPLILAMEVNPEIRTMIEEDLRSGNLDPARIQAMVLEAGGAEKTRELAQAYYDKAVLELEGLDLEAEKAFLMRQLLERAWGHG